MHDNPVHSASEYWSQLVESRLAALQTSSDGLSAADASSRLIRYGPNALEARETASAILAEVCQTASVGREV